MFLLTTMIAANACSPSVPVQTQEALVKGSPLQENIGEILATDLNKCAPDDLVKLLHRTWNCLVHETPEETIENKTYLDELALCQKAALIKTAIKKSTVPVPAEPDMLKDPESMKGDELPPCQGLNRKGFPKYRAKKSTQSFGIPRPTYVITYVNLQNNRNLRKHDCIGDNFKKTVIRLQ